MKTTKIRILKDKGLVKKGEVYEIRHTRSRKVFISVEGTDIDINKYLPLDGYEVV